jgi:short-subunit dehydrogenase
MGMFEEVPTEAHRRLIDINLFGVIHGAKAALPIFRRQGRGVLINVASVAGKAGYRLASSYCASKAAVRGLSEALRQETLGTGVSVVTVFPGPVDTPLFNQSANFTGRKLRPLTPPLYDADRIAAAIVSAAFHPRPEVVIGSAPRLLGLLHALWPSAFDRVMASNIEKRHFEDAPALRTAGNLYSPSPEKRVDGGWKSRAPRVIGTVAGLAFGLAALRAAAPRLLRA